MQQLYLHSSSEGEDKVHPDVHGLQGVLSQQWIQTCFMHGDQIHNNLQLSLQPRSITAISPEPY